LAYGYRYDFAEHPNVLLRIAAMIGENLMVEKVMTTKETVEKVQILPFSEIHM
jgi:hypothetical protein